VASLQIPITKAGKTAFIEVNTADITEGGDMTEEVLREALVQGLKVLLNRGMSKITKESFAGDTEKMNAAAMKKAEQTFADMRENKIRFTGSKPKKEVTGEVMTEAMRLARNLVKQGLKDEGIKIAHVDAKEITKVAKELLAERTELIEQAKATVAARKSAAEQGIDLKGFAKKVAVNPKKKAAAEAEAAEKKAASSAAKAGKVAVRAKAKPGREAQATQH
jgi:colicin import membrane protein